MQTQPTWVRWGYFGCGSAFALATILLVTAFLWLRIPMIHLQIIRDFQRAVVGHHREHPSADGVVDLCAFSDFPGAGIERDWHAVVNGSTRIIEVPRYDFECVFSPITPAGYTVNVDMATFSVPRVRFWLYCRRSGGRFDLDKEDTYTVIFDDLGRDTLLDRQISWFYQKRVRGLDQEELAREREYRRANGLPELGL